MCLRAFGFRLEGVDTMPYKNGDKCEKCGIGRTKFGGLFWDNKTVMDEPTPPKFSNPSPRFFSETSTIIAVEELPNQKADQQKFYVVLGKEGYSEERNDGFFTRLRRGEDGEGEWAGHYNMNLMEASVDFSTRLSGTGKVLQMLGEQVRDIKR